MSSSYVADTADDHKTDNTLIIIVNNDGSISVDQETLQNLLANQQNTAVSVVRVGGTSQGDDSSQDSSGTCDSQNDGSPHVNLTVEGYYPAAAAGEAAAAVAMGGVDAVPISDSPATSGPGAVNAAPPPSTAEGESLDPFLEMDPEQLERLETALQSEQAKQILGENVTAMLDMLTVEEETPQQHHSVLMDHCYTNLAHTIPSSGPSMATPVSTQPYGTTTTKREEAGALLVDQPDQLQQVTPSGMGPPTVQVVRGRGRGRPGRPRRDMSSTRGTAYSSTRGTRGALGRGGIKVQRGGTVVTGAGGNMIMVQQIKQINPPLTPPPSTPASATLIPLVRPLVISSTPAGQLATSPIRAAVPGQVQKQLIAVPPGARLVALSAKPGPIDQTAQQTVLLTSATGQVVQTQSIQGTASITSSAPNMSAKVVVAKMPVLPPQLLGAQAQPSTLPLSDQPPQHLQKEDESDFTDFPQEPSEDSDSDDSDIGSDEEYRDPTVGSRRGGRGMKGRGRFGRAGRWRGGQRVYEGGRGGRGARRGRGRGLVRPEELDRAKKLEAEMAAVVAAMEKSPEVEKAGHHDVREKPVTKKEELVGFPVDISPVEASEKKMLKVYGKSVRKNSDAGEKLHIKIDNTNLKDKSEKSPIHTPTEKKSPIMKPIKKQPVEMPRPPVTPAPAPAPAPATPTTPTTPVAAASDARKNYPKRENRKPPAHLAEALGPALFSTPDIIRRVSTGGEQKQGSDTPPSDEKKDTQRAIAPGVVEPVEVKEAEEENVPVAAPVPETSRPDLSPETMAVAPTGSVLMDTLNSELKTEEELLAEALLLQEQVGEDAKVTEIKLQPVPSETSLVKSEESDSALLEPTQEIKPRMQTHLPGRISPGMLKTHVLSATRTSRRRSSTSAQHQNSDEPASKKEANKLTKDKRKNEEKQKGRRQSADVDDDEEMGSSDDDSWNSEDDPDRLWCICKKPHNNRFMICCDVCEDWFHGKCVGVTKAMGQQMENKGLEWSCPNCAKKKEEEKESKKHPPPVVQKEKEVKRIREGKKDMHIEETEELAADIKDVVPPGEGSSQPGSSSDAQIMYCIVCKKEARPSSIYCSDACILKHAQESLNVINKEKAVAAGAAVAATGSRDSAQQMQQQQVNAKGSEAGRQGGGGAGLPAKARPDARVIVYERKTGRLLAGPNAPTAGNLKTWLKDNPTFEVVRPGVLPTNKFYGTKAPGKTVLVQSAKLTQQKPSSPQQKVGQPQPSSSSAPVQNRPVASQKITVIPQKVTQQKLPPNPTKTGIALQKTSAAQQIPGKVIPTKVQKGPIVVAAQPQKVAVKTVATKSPTTSVKGTTKFSSPPASSNMKVPSSPSNKIPPANAVSKVPATSTVKEAGKAQAEKPTVKKVEVKRQSSSTSNESTKKEEEKDKPSGPEPIRLNVRKTLQELLQARIQECPDLEVPESEVQSIALNIEEEMHSFFRDTGIKYKSKYRSLVFNIKDPKNLTLFRKIADKSLTPHQLVRLSPDELASQELAQWREREAKHQLEMIKKNELELMSQAKTYVLKTHKGEQVIETDESLKVEVPELVDPSSVPDLVSPVNNSVSSTVEDTELDKVKIKVKDKESKEKSSKDEKEHGRDREKSKDDKRREKGERSRKEDKDKRDSRHDRHDRDKRRDSKERDKKSSSKHRSSEKSKHDSDKHKDGKSSRKEKKEETDSKKDEIKKEHEDREEGDKVKKLIVKEDPKTEPEVSFKPKLDLFTSLKSEPLEDSDLSDREPSSTVTIKTPDINIEDQERNVSATLWKGFVSMPDVAKFFTSVQVVSGDPQNLCKDLPDTLDIVGRIVPETVWEYIKKMKKTGTKEILVIRLSAANEEEKIPYVTLYTYLNTRNRLGVVGNVSKMIKDFYIMPLASHNPVPDVLLPLDGPGFEDYRPHLLLGILVRARRKRLAPENEYVAKPPKRPPPPPVPVSAEPTERSYTPPLPTMGNDILGSLTPPHPPPASVSSYTPPSSPQHFLPGPSHIMKNTDPRLSRKDSMQEDLSLNEKSAGVSVKIEKPSLASHVGQYGLDDDDYDDDDDDDDDDDAPYSPGGSDVGESSEDNLMATPKNPSELQRKVEELNRKIEEQKQQIQSISSAIGSDQAVGALGSEALKVSPYMLGSEEGAALAEEGDENEAYSPSRSFTPPATIPFIGPAESGSTPVFSTLPSNINLPSNLHEILASIKKKESDKAAGGTAKGINLKSDPIVQNYGKAGDLEASQPKTPTDDFSSPVASSSASYSSGASASTASPGAASSSILQSASSALLSLSTPVVHPLVASTTASSKVVDTKIHRDPRQRGTEITSKSSGSTLSTLSDDDLIKKALEMEMEMTEPKIKTGVTVDQTLQQPPPPGVDSPAGPGSSSPLKPSLVSKSIPVGQPLPPGVEDEEYPSYSSAFAAPQNTIPPLPPSNYSMQTATSPAQFRMPHHYSGPSYMGPPPRVPPQGPGYSSTYTPPGYSGSKNVEDSSKMKRKFSDCEADDSGAKRDRSDSPNGGGRDSWDNKVPVPVRGRFNVRGRGYMRGSPSAPRGYVRPRGGMNHSPMQSRSRWDNKNLDRKRPSHYEQRPDWEQHSKDFDNKHRDRKREARHRERDREQDKSSSSQRSHSNTRSSRSKESDKGSDSS